MKTAEQRNIAILEIAITEANRFIEKANDAIERYKSDDNVYQRKEVSAVKRSALDLRQMMTTVNNMKAF